MFAAKEKVETPNVTLVMRQSRSVDIPGEDLADALNMALICVVVLKSLRMVCIGR